MGQSAGPGSPIMFRCSRCRRNCRTWNGSWYAFNCEHKTALTGKWRKRKFCVGVRSALVEVQYECDCGHVGWSNHVDLVRRAKRDGVVPLEVVLK